MIYQKSFQNADWICFQIHKQIFWPVYICMHLADMSIQSDLLRNFSETIKFNKWYCLSGCFFIPFCFKFLCVRLGLDRDYLMSLIWSLFDMHTYSQQPVVHHLIYASNSPAQHSWLTGCSVYVSVSCCVMETALSICFSLKALLVSSVFLCDFSSSPWFLTSGQE